MHYVNECLPGILVTGFVCVCVLTWDIFSAFHSVHAEIIFKQGRLRDIQWWSSNYPPFGGWGQLCREQLKSLDYIRFKCCSIKKSFKNACDAKYKCKLYFPSLSLKVILVSVSHSLLIVVIDKKSYMWRGDWVMVWHNCSISEMFHVHIHKKPWGLEQGDVFPGGMSCHLVRHSNSFSHQSAITTTHISNCSIEDIHPSKFCPHRGLDCTSAPLTYL